MFEAGEAEDGQLSAEELADDPERGDRLHGNGFEPEAVFGTSYDFKYTLEGTAL